MSAGEMMRAIGRWLDDGVAWRVGGVVRHRALGYEANAMVVWDAPDAEANRIGTAMAAESCVTLCYRRPRSLPAWRYNLFCMIHGRERAAVLQQIGLLRERLRIAQLPYDVLFSPRCFKQRGARYAKQVEAAHG